MKASMSATAAGSRITVYFPGSIPVGFLAIAALLMAVSASAPGCSSRSSLNDFDAHPEPEPSGVRAVRL